MNEWAKAMTQLELKATVSTNIYTAKLTKNKQTDKARPHSMRHFLMADKRKGMPSTAGMLPINRNYESDCV